jgi:rhodanese-related sulfurtransferase
MQIRMKVLFAALLVAVMALLAGCGGSSHVDATGSTVIDVRTAGEYAGGHLRGATNIDVESGDFASQVNTLPKDKTYLLYCRTGVRADKALTIMKQQGFTHVSSLGGIQDASNKTGLPIVTP